MIDDAQLSTGQAASGLWCEIVTDDFNNRPALFLDRDGVIVEDAHYLGRPEDLRMLSGAAAAVARCNRLEIPVVLVSNQSGIARRLYDWQGFHAVQAALSAALGNAGARLDAVFACAYHADGSAPFNIADLSRSWIVGNRASDIAAGHAAHLEGGILVSPSEDDPERKAAIGLKIERFAVDISGSLEAAVSVLLSRGCLAAREPLYGG
jgi:D-glycero-D-manno-heptose 1,7-bisphosphate phosphatase